MRASPPVCWRQIPRAGFSGHEQVAAQKRDNDNPNLNMPSVRQAAATIGQVMVIQFMVRYR
jgi:hypothetical protein